MKRMPSNGVPSGSRGAVVTTAGSPQTGTIVNDEPDLDSATISYTPGTPDPEGNDPFATFDFTVVDGNGGSDTATVGINENDAQPDPPGVSGVDAKPMQPMPANT